MTYILRDERGTMKAKLSNRLAGGLIDNCKGAWTLKKYVSGKTANAYVISEDMALGDVNTFGILIYLWKNDYIVLLD